MRMGSAGNIACQDTDNNPSDNDSGADSLEKHGGEYKQRWISLPGE